MATDAERAALLDILEKLRAMTAQVSDCRELVARISADVEEMGRREDEEWTLVLHEIELAGRSALDDED